MLLLSTGLILFLFPHLWREFGLRSSLIKQVASESTYKIIFSLMSLAGLILIVYGKAQAPFVMIWEPLFEWRWLSHLLMLPALILVMAGNLPMSHFRIRLRHPMLLGTCLWGLAHLWANGDLASMLLFGSFALWAGLKFFTLRKEPRPPKSPKFVWDVLVLVSGLLLYGLIFIFHGQLFGVGISVA
jgi:uncharacterized membrane protein